MKRCSVWALLVLVLAVAALPAAAITGGQLDEEEHPNVGAIIRDYGAEAEPRYRVLCSGTLIGDTVFLTAAHCTTYLQYLLDMEAIEAAIKRAKKEPNRPSLIACRTHIGLGSPG